MYFYCLIGFRKLKSASMFGLPVCEYGKWGGEDNASFMSAFPPTLFACVSTGGFDVSNILVLHVCVVVCGVVFKVLH